MHMEEISYLKEADKSFWHGLDKHLPEKEIEKNVCQKWLYSF